MAGAALRGFDELEAGLAALKGKAANAVVRKAARAGAKPILKTAKANVPKKTGLLRRMLKIRAPRRQKSGQYRVRIGTNRGDGAAYGVPVEYGTDRMPARPFLRNAVASSAPAATAAVKEDLGKGIDKAFKGKG